MPCYIVSSIGLILYNNSVLLKAIASSAHYWVQSLPLNSEAIIPVLSLDTVPWLCCVLVNMRYMSEHAGYSPTHTALPTIVLLLSS